jgi:hypothetical protein
MLQRRIPQWLRHSPAPSVKGFAALAGIEAMSRVILISVFPLVIYRVYQDTGTVSQIYFFVGVASMMFGSVFPILLDICAGLPVLMAVKPSERTEMSAIYSTYRDVSGIITPGVAWRTLLVAPISAIFAVAGAGLILAWSIAGGLHPRLGTRRTIAITVKPSAGSIDT